MSNSASVDEAIKKGHKTVTYPSTFIIVSILLLTFTLAILEIFSLWIIAVGFILAFIMPWVYWGMKITKWRLWAFQNVRNVHELQHKAIEENLIWEEGHIFESLEIRNASDKLQWKALQEKFFEDDLFTDDFNLPTKTAIYHANRKNFFLLFAIAISFTVGMVNIFTAQHLIVGVISIALFGYLLSLLFKKGRKKAPHIILDDNGIQTTSPSKLYKWEDITNDGIVDEGSQRLGKTYLSFTHPQGTEKIELEDLAIEKKRLENLIKIYKGRNKLNDKEKAISSFFRNEKK